VRPWTSSSKPPAASECRSGPSNWNEPQAAALYERKLVLVRPDGHVAWRGDAPPADPLAMIDRVRGAL
jgi:Aromatic-ring hydroxylase, C-terminal